MATLRVSEVYRSVQGEGPRVGQPTIFVRFGGCNLRCPGWPCDTPHAIDTARYRHEWRQYEVSALADRIYDVGSASDNICFTGGEPWLQNSDAIEDLIETLLGDQYPTFEVFTNGTLPFPEWATEQLYTVMDWKLPGAGEAFTEEQEQVRMNNALMLDNSDAIKFVIADDQDFEAAVAAWHKINDMLIKEGGPWCKPMFYYGVVWGKMENADLIAKVLERELPWILNMQTHNHIWPRDQRGI